MNTARRLVAFFFLVALFSVLQLSSQEKPNPADITIPRASLDRDFLTYSPSSKGVTAPKVTYSPDPGYSDAARKARVQGKVVLKIVVDKNGRVKVAEVTRGLEPSLDKNAIEAVEKWIFEPAKKNGVPVSVQVHVEVNFRLQ